jgi:hypothetical protein
VSRKNHPREANLFYWNEHYAPINNMSRLLCDITKLRHQLNLCLRCFGHFGSPETLTRHKQMCTREDFMSVVHILPNSDSKDSHITFKQFTNTSNAPFVIYADFESILQKVDIQNKRTHYDQQHKLCSAAAILYSQHEDMQNKLMLFSGPNTLEDFLNKPID